MTEVKNPFITVMEDNKRERNEIKAMRNEPITFAKRNGVAIATIGGASILSIMFAAQIITGMFALLFMAVGGAALIYGARAIKHFDPVIMDKMRCKAIELRMRNARENAIEFLTNEVLKRHEKYEHAKQALKGIKGKYMQFDSKIAQARSEQTANNIQEMKDRTGKAIELFENKLKALNKNNNQFEDKVSDYKLMDEMNDHMGNILAVIGSEFDSKMDEMLSLEAFGSIADEYYENAAEIDTLTLELGD